MDILAQNRELRKKTKDLAVFGKIMCLKNKSIYA